MAFVYNLISLREELYPSIIGVEYATEQLALLNKPVLIDGDASKVYILKNQIQIYFRNPDDLVELEGSQVELRTPYTFSSVEANGVELLTSDEVASSYSTLPTATDGYTTLSNTYPALSTKLRYMYDILAVYFQSVFTANSIPFLGVLGGFTDVNKGFFIIASEGDSFSSIFENSSADFEIGFSGTAAYWQVGGLLKQTSIGGNNNYVSIFSDRYYIMQSELSISEAYLTKECLLDDSAKRLGCDILNGLNQCSDICHNEDIKNIFKNKLTEAVSILVGNEDYLKANEVINYNSNLNKCCSD